VQDLAYREQSLWNSGAFGLVDGFAPDRERDWGSLVGACVVELAIHQDGDGNEVGAAVGGKFQQAQSARTGLFCFAAELRVSRLGDTRGEQGADDGAAGPAV
jgi:hypothetical protein